MKRISAAFLIIAAALPLGAQTTQKLQAGKPNEYALIYSLPTTTLDITLEAEKTVRTPGEFFRYAKKYLGVDPITEPSSSYELKSVIVNPRGITDPEERYQVQFKSGSTPFMMIDGQNVPLSVNYPDVSLPEPPGLPAPREAKPTILEMPVAKQAVTAEMLQSPSSAKRAELAAARIYELRETRSDILSGNADNMPADGQAMQLVLDNLAAQEELNVTFAPKITTGKAGSGLHVHIRLMKGDASATATADGLTDYARRAIAGLMVLAPALTAFGNTNPTSYFRLVPNQEAPTSICWGDRNRSVLVRVPLGWTAGADMCAIANGAHAASECPEVDASVKPTFEIRNADGSADVYRLLAGICVALRYGLEMDSDKALDIARNTYVDTDIHHHPEVLARLRSLPADCAASAEALVEFADVFTDRGVFSPEMIAGVVGSLRSFDSAEAAAARSDNSKMLDMVHRYFHCG